MVGSADPQSKMADALKLEGNALFGKQKYLAAMEKYTEAITLNPKLAALYVNRAMCNRKREDWEQVVQDCKQALLLDREYMKAHYLLGLAQRELGELDVALSHLSKALEAAREKGDTIKDDIWRELARAKYTAWQIASLQRREAQGQLRQQLQGLMAAQLEAARVQGPQAEQQVLQQQQVEKQRWDRLFAASERQDTKREVPSAYTCPLTMEVYRDPAVTPSGRSYERSALLEHLQKVGRFDPVTRQPMTSSDVWPNAALRVATMQFLDEHPWAWGECF